MPHYKALFRIPGDKELKAHNGYVPDAFFTAAQHTTTNDIVLMYEGGFVLSSEMHEKLNHPDRFISYASVGADTDEGNQNSEEFKNKLLLLLKQGNHARPLESHFHYQVFVMEYIEPVIDDD
ncbi:hypothetical protein ACLI1A_01640 [Flavobacterium sp. RHBU_3]|uniref:hypothetical protein n=1 Tax=Flavobacterium sp. RHBU_3 TaxID=3391184 RepID=UPI0039854723